MKCLVLADAHLGLPSFKNEKKLISLLKQGWDEVIINGDFYELLGFESKACIEREYKAIFDELKNHNVVWINGNHDVQVGIDEYQITLPDSRRVIVTHGHKFDAPTNPLAIKINTVVYDLFGFELRLLLKPFKNYKPVFEKLLAYYQGKCDVLVVGHSHSFLEIGMLKNCGDFLEHTTCIQIVDNEISRIVV